MEFTILPPEIISALIHSGPGAESLMEASAAWQQLSGQLEESAGAYSSALAPLTGVWRGPAASAMIEAIQPYLAWLRSTAQQCQQAAEQAYAAVTAFASVQASVVPVAAVTANRTRLVQLLATNVFGSKLPAIAQTEDEYQTMWANNSAALTRYEAASKQATALQQFDAPPEVTDQAATAAQSGVLPTATSSSTSRVVSAVSNAALAPAADPITDFDPNAGLFGLVNTYANQFVSSGFPINLLSYLAQNNSAQALQAVGGDIGQGLSEGIGSVEGGGLGALGAAGLSATTPSAAIGTAASIGKLSAPPAVVGLLPGSQVQLASAASPLPAGDAEFPMPPLMPPPISPSGAGSGWRKRKGQKYDDIQIGKELKGTVMPRPPSAG